MGGSGEGNNSGDGDTSGMGGDTGSYGGGDYSGWGTDTGGSLGANFAGSDDWGGGGIGPDTSMFAAFDTTGYGIDNGNYSDAAMPGYDAVADPGLMDQFTRFFKSPIGKIGMSLAARANPNLGFVNSLIGTATKAGQIGNAATRGPGMGHFGGIAGAALGSAFAGPIGGMLGGYAGNALGNAAGQGSANYSGPSGATPGDGGMGLGTGLGLGLASLYQNYKNNKESGGQLSSLQNMYGQNSPYSQALRQQLERRDAASGRRSQYGPREVELQAQLAQMASRNAPAVNQLLQMRNQQRGQNLGQLAGIYQQMGGMRGIQGGLQGLYSDVGGMFTGMDQYDNTGYGIDNTFDTGSFNDVMPDTWGG